MPVNKGTIGREWRKFLRVNAGLGVALLFGDL